MRPGSVVLDSGGETASGAPLLVDSLEVGLVTQAVELPFLAWAPLPLAGPRRMSARQAFHSWARSRHSLAGWSNHPIIP